METVLSRITEEVCGKYVVISGNPEDLLAIIPLLQEQTFIYSNGYIYVYCN